MSCPWPSSGVLRRPAKRGEVVAGTLNGARHLANKKRVLVMFSTIEKVISNPRRDRSKDAGLPGWYVEILDGLVQRGLIIHRRHQSAQQ